MSFHILETRIALKLYILVNHSVAVIIFMILYQAILLSVFVVSTILLYLKCMFIIACHIYTYTNARITLFAYAIGVIDTANFNSSNKHNQFILLLEFEYPRLEQNVATHMSTYQSYY